MNDLTGTQASTLAEAMGKPGWTYYDLPQMALDYFELIQQIIGPGNLCFITYANRSNSDGTSWHRGQILISPEGMDNIRAYRDSQTDS